MATEGPPAEPAEGRAQETTAGGRPAQDNTATPGGSAQETSTQADATQQAVASSEVTDSTTRTVQGFYLVRNSVYTVGGLFVAGMIGAVVVGFTGGDASTISAMLTAVTGIIGSLVGAYFGIQVGNAGRQETEERVEGHRQEAQETLNKALAVLPREDAAAILDIDLPQTRRSGQGKEKPVEEGTRSSPSRPRRTDGSPSE